MVKPVHLLIYNFCTTTPYYGNCCQRLATFSAKAVLPFKGIGSGIFEIVTRFDSDTYRTVYAVQIGEHIYVLHAFQKKSPKGIKTAQKDIYLIKNRYKQALETEKKN